MAAERNQDAGACALTASRALVFDDNGGFVGIAGTVDTHLELDGGSFAKGADTQS
jgi:hypothetical protein